MFKKSQTWDLYTHQKTKQKPLLTPYQSLFFRNIMPSLKFTNDQESLNSSGCLDKLLEQLLKVRNRNLAKHRFWKQQKLTPEKHKTASAGPRNRSSKHKLQSQFLGEHLLPFNENYSRPLDHITHIKRKNNSCIPPNKTISTPIVTFPSHFLKSHHSFTLLSAKSTNLRSTITTQLHSLTSFPKSHHSFSHVLKLIIRVKI